MEDTSLYETVLGLQAPWTVTGVELKPAEETVEVTVESTQRRWPCPACQTECSQHDTRPRRWRHLDTCQFQTILLARVPRVRCPRHGVKQIQVPWADPGSSFTALFEQRVIRWLREASISAVAELFGLSWSVIDGIQGRAVRRGLKRRSAEEDKRLPRRLGIDETSFQKRHEYVTVICDQKTGFVTHVADGRSKQVVCDFLDGFSEKDRAAVRTVAMDMWPAYIGAIRSRIPDAETKICFDKFHVAQHLGKAVDRVRNEEHRRLGAGPTKSPLTSTRYLWVTGARNLTRKQKQELESLVRVAKKTGRAWALKEACMATWRYSSRHHARKALKRWYAWAIRSRLEPMKKIARMVKKHLEGIVNAMHHGVTNARSEGLNSRIQWIKYTARGFRNRDRFRRAIYFHLAGLDMTPAALQPIQFHTT